MNRSNKAGDVTTARTRGYQSSISSGWVSISVRIGHGVSMQSWRTGTMSWSEWEKERKQEEERGSRAETGIKVRAQEV